MSNTFLDAALEYLRLGFSVIPLRPKAKEPALGSWREYQGRRAAEDEIRRWWTSMPAANVGIATGAVSGIVVLDVDGEQGRASLDGKQLPATACSSTGKGYHYFFKHPGGTVGNAVGLLPGVDVRGDGGYVVAPPSLHPSGRVYEWALHPVETPPAAMPQWLLELLRAKPGASSNDKSEKLDPVQVLAGVPEGERDQTLFRYACRLRSKGMTKEEALALVLQAAANCIPPFPEKEARIKVDQAWKYDGPPEVVVLERIKAGAKAEDVFVPEIIGALAAMKKANPTEYARTKAELKQRTGVNLNDLERAVNRQVAANQGLHEVQPEEGPVELREILDDCPAPELRAAPLWNITANGIWQQTKNGPVCACPVPVVLTRRLRNVDTCEEKVELAFRRDGKWRSVTADRATVFNRSSLIMLANKGLPVTSESAKHLVRYLADLEQANLDSLPLVRSVNHMGWVGNRFIPGAAGDLVLDVEEGGAGAVAAGYHESGTLQEWIEAVKPVRQHPLARAALAAAFAAPLLKLLNQRVFILHLWGPSRGGKTAALKAALSVWGSPEDLIASFNATKVGLERLASFYSDLPLGIDERQVVGDKQGFVESLVYLLGLGKGKARGAKNGGLQQFATWRTLAISTGEEPLSREGSAGGIATRTIELYGKPIPDEELAGQIHANTNEIYGTAGPVFIRKLIELLKADPNYLYANAQFMREILKYSNEDNAKAQLDALATILLGDFYASQWIFGLDEKTAGEEAAALGDALAGQLETATEMDDGSRAMEYLLSWFGENKTKFTTSDRERYGMLEGDKLYIFPSAFDPAIKNAGFNPKRVLRDWAERGWIETEERDGKKRYKIRKWDGTAQLYFVCVLLSKVTAVA